MFNGSTLDYSKVQNVFDTRSVSQMWTLYHGKDRTVRFIHAKSGKALTVDEGPSFARGHVHIYTDNNLNSQRWRLQPVTNGHYQLIHALSGQVLQSPHNQTEGNINVELRAKNDSVSQRWRLVRFDGNSRLSTDRCEASRTELA